MRGHSGGVAWNNLFFSSWILFENY